jgi:hypothetical protein
MSAAEQDLAVRLAAILDTPPVRTGGRPAPRPVPVDVRPRREDGPPPALDGAEPLAAAVDRPGDGEAGSVGDGVSAGPAGPGIGAPWVRRRRRPWQRGWRIVRAWLLTFLVTAVVLLVAAIGLFGPARVVGVLAAAARAVLGG